MGFLLATVSERQIPFNLLDIVVKNTRLTSPSQRAVYPYTEFCESADVHTIYMSTFQASEIQFTATLIHEFAHVLLDYKENHEALWAKTCFSIFELVQVHVTNLNKIPNYNFSVNAKGITITKMIQIDPTFIFLNSGGYISILFGT